MSERVKFWATLLIIVPLCGLVIAPVVWFHAALALWWWLNPESFAFLSVTAALGQVASVAAFFMGLYRRAT